MRVIIFLFLLFLVPFDSANAQSSNIEQVGTSTFELSAINMNQQLGGNGFHFNLYANTYPASSSLIAGNTTNLNYPFPIGDLTLAVCQSYTQTTITCNPEIHTDVDGQYWYSLKYPGGNEVWYQFTRFGGNWSTQFSSSSYTPSGIISTSPTGGIGSTTQTFSATYVSGQPFVDTICLQIEQQNGYQSIIPIVRCQSINQNGTFTFSTTTTLQNNAFYTWQFTLKNGSTTVDRSFLQTMNVGTIPWNSTLTDYNNSTSTQPINEICNTYTSNTAGAFLVPMCKMLFTVFGIPGQVLTQVMITTQSQLQQTAPISWYIQLSKIWTDATFSSTQLPVVAISFMGHQNEIFSRNSFNKFLTPTGIQYFKAFTTAGIALLFLIYLQIVITKRII